MVSIIIVNYHASKDIFLCLSSISSSKTKCPYEIIVVDNDEKKTIQQKLKKEFPEVRYLSNINKGFGEANNRGAEIAKGKYLYFLNPDTQILPKSIDALYQFISRKDNCGAVSPLLLGTNKKPYHQGEKILTPFRGIIALSFINKMFPNNPISRYYRDDDAVHDIVRNIDIVPGTAFIIRKDIFTEVCKFDEKFFLYFEEFDLCKKLVEKGYKNYIIPEAKVIHLGAQSTKTREDIDEIFSNSRFYYFKKHYGLIAAICVNVFTSFGKAEGIVLCVCLINFFLATFQLQERAPFIGDQGWFFLSARDMLLTGNVPLVGIASSHPWLHQGALWTYLLGIALFFGKFHPISGYYLSILIGIITLLVLYFVVRKMFGKYIAVIATLLYATSAEIISSTQLAYHTTPIALLTLGYIYSLYAIRKGNTLYIPISLLFLSLLYQVELFTIILMPLLVLTMWYVMKKRNTLLPQVEKQTLIFLSVFVVLSFLPIIFYDVKHGFAQTIGFVSWMIYSVLKAIHIFPANEDRSSISSILQFMIKSIQNLLFYTSHIIALVILGGGIGTVILKYKKFLARNDFSYTLIIGWFILPILGIFLTKTPSHAYLHALYPVIFIFISIALVTIVKSMILRAFIVAIIVFTNSYSVVFQLPIDHNSYKFGLNRRIEVARQIVREASGRPFNLFGEGEGSQFASFTMNMEYLVWWLGGKEVKEPVNLQFTITETPEGIFVTSPSQYARMLQ